MKGVNQAPPSPIRGEVFKELELQVDPQLAARAKNVAQLRSIDAKALEEFADQYVREVLAGNTIFNGQRHSPVTMLKIDLRPSKLHDDDSDEQLAASLKRRIAGAGLELAKIWSDGIVHERELLPLGKVLQSIDTILEMHADRKIAMAGREAKPKIEAAFAELTALAQAARAQLGKLQGDLQTRDHAALTERLRDPTPTYRTVDLAAISAAKQGLVSVGRFAPGDLIVAELSGGKARWAIVAGEENGKLRVELPGANGAVETRLLSQKEVVRNNPLKAGDHFELDGRQIWIRPSKEGIVAEEREGLQIRSVDVAVLGAELRERLGLLNVVLADAKVKRADPSRIFVASGNSTQGIERLPSELAGAAAVSEPGPRSRFNDDATVLASLEKADGTEVIVAGVADQASGGRGEPGFVSSQAAAALLHAGEIYAKGVKAAKEALVGAVDDTDQRCRHQGLSTLTGAILEKAQGGKGLDGELIHVGDSIAWQFSSRGRLEYSTPEHNLGRRVADAAGDPNANPGLAMRLSRAIGENATGKSVHQKIHLDPGDFLVFVTHGGSQANLLAQIAAHEEGKNPLSVFHSELTAMHIGQIVSRAENAHEATRQIREYILAQMNQGDGRPENNLSVVVVQAPR